MIFAILITAILSRHLSSTNNQPPFGLTLFTALPSTSTRTNEDLFKSYLGRTFSGQLAVVAKPQCNFISNLACIKQILDESNYYASRRCKPFSTVKLRAIYSETSGDTESESEEAAECPADGHKRLRATRVIVIDDNSEDLHKPWITPELIKLIKHRNLLQAKLAASSNAEAAGPDDELLKKFKNLRNKVTKLVKKSRSEFYLVARFSVSVLFIVRM